MSPKAVSSLLKCQINCPYPIPLLHGLVAKLFDCHKYPHSVSNFLDPHIPENILVALEKVITVEIVSSKERLVLLGFY